MHWAAMVDNLDALKLLISHGPDTIKDVQNNKVREMRDEREREREREHMSYCSAL